jgi:hypothetical protein
MHTVHYAPKDGNSRMIAAVIGIIFDTVRYDTSIPQKTIDLIDSFFDSLTLDNLNDPTVAAIPFAKLMNSIDTNNRWVYNGSLTIYWNVVGTVYPIKQKHLELF